MKRLASVLAAVATSAAVQAGSIDGVWEAKTSIGEVDVPFRVQFSGEGENFKGTLFDGDVPVTSTSGKLEGDHFVLKFDHFLGKLKGTIRDGRIEGTYTNVGREGGYAHQFSAVRPSNTPVVAAKDVPSIDGQWVIPHESSKGEKAWKLIIQQKGDDAKASILRIDGDTGALTGRYQDDIQLYGNSNEAGLLLLCGQTPAKLTADFDGQVAHSSCVGKVPEDGTIFSVLGHMHTLGKSFRLTIDPGKPDQKILLDIPVWNFDWQLNYELVTPLHVHRGDEVEMECSWDRSLDPNRPPKYIVFAEGTEDEMCFGTYALIPDDQSGPTS